MVRRTFTLEFQASAARLVREQGYSVPQAAERLGIDPRSIRDWGLATILSEMGHST